MLMYKMILRRGHTVQTSQGVAQGCVPFSNFENCVRFLLFQDMDKLGIRSAVLWVGTIANTNIKIPRFLSYKNTLKRVGECGS